MTVYAVVLVTRIHDPETYAKYGAGFMGVFEKYEGELLAITDTPVFTPFSLNPFSLIPSRFLSLLPSPSTPSLSPSPFPSASTPLSSNSTPPLANADTRYPDGPRKRLALPKDRDTEFPEQGEDGGVVLQ